MNREIAAEIVRQKAGSYAVKYITPGEKSESYKETILSDVEDMKRVAKCIKAGNLSTAYRLAENLDTIVREEIPTEVWNYLYDNKS